MLSPSNSESVRTAPRPGGCLKITSPSSSDIILLDSPSSSNPLLANTSSKTCENVRHDLFLDAMTIRSTYAAVWAVQKLPQLIRYAQLGFYEACAFDLYLGRPDYEYFVIRPQMVKDKFQGFRSSGLLS